MKATNNHNPINVLSNKRKYKDTYFRNQTAIVYGFLQTNTATNSMVSKAIGIPQTNLICYKQFEVERKLCELTGFKAYLTTNENLL